MLFYFITFCIIGFMLGVVFKNSNVAFGIVAVITICWAFIFGLWAMATFIELILGYAVAKSVMKENN